MPGQALSSGVHNLIMEIHSVLNENLKRKLSWDKESLPLGTIKMLHLSSPPGSDTLQIIEGFIVSMSSWVVETAYLKVEDSFLAGPGEKLEVLTFCM